MFIIFLRVIQHFRCITVLTHILAPWIPVLQVLSGNWQFSQRAAGKPWPRFWRSKACRRTYEMIMNMGMKNRMEPRTAGIIGHPALFLIVIACCSPGMWDWDGRRWSGLLLFLSLSCWQLGRVAGLLQTAEICDRGDLKPVLNIINYWCWNI